MTVDVLGKSENWRPRHLFTVLFSEFLLCFLFCFFVVSSTSGRGLRLFEAGITTGLLIQACIQCLQHVSGSHFNPAITVMVFSLGGMSLPMAILYILFQMLGSVAGSALGYYAIPKSIAGSYALMLLHEDITPFQGVVIEMMGTFLLVIVAAAVTDANRKVIMPPGGAPIAIGLTMAAVIISVGNLTMGCSNPIRAFGPAVITNSWDNHWVFWVGPLGGSVVISLIYRFLFQGPPSVDTMDSCELQQMQMKEMVTKDNQL